MADLFGFEKIGNVGRRRLAHQILGLVYLFETSGSHDRDTVRQGDAVRYIVGDVNGPAKRSAT